MMKKSMHRTIRAATAGVLLFSAINLFAQDAPPQGFDPAQMRQRRMEQIRQTMDVKDEAEWTALSERITAVMDLRRTERGLAGGGRFGGPGGPGRPGGPPPRRNNPDGGPNDGGNAGPADFRGPPPGAGGPGGPRRQLAPEAEALQKAIDAKAPAAELKTKLAELRTARQKNRAELEKAQDDLRQLLTTQQEAAAVTLGLL